MDDVEIVVPTVEPVAEPVAEPVVEPVVEPVAEPVAEPVVEPVVVAAPEPPKVTLTTKAATGISSITSTIRSSGAKLTMRR